MEINKKLGDISGKSKTLHSIGRIYQNKGESEKALKCFNESLEINKKLGNISGRSKTLHQIGIIYQLKGEYREALKCFNESLEIYEKLEDISGRSQTIYQIGMIYQDKREYEEALKCFNASMEIFEKLGDISGVAIIKGQTGNLYIELKRYKEAFIIFIEAYIVLKKIGSPYQKLAIKELLNVKKFLDEDYYRDGLKKAGIDEGELSDGEKENENPLIGLTMMSLSGDVNAGEQLLAVLDRFTDEVRESDEGKLIYRCIKFLYDLAHADDKAGFIKSADDAMVKMMVGFVGEENMPQ